MKNSINLQYFLDAQKMIYKSVLSELQQGKKTGHWMWFIFPQFVGFGQSDIAVLYSIKSLDEAREYLEHNVLGSRLQECSQLVLNLPDVSIRDVFSYPDNLKLHSSMTLFARVPKADSVFYEVIVKFYNGQLDNNTIDLIG